MNLPARLGAVVAYVPVIGWLYVTLSRREDDFVMYHLWQAVGLVLFLIGALLGWAVVAWLLAWLPYMGALGIALFTLVIVAYLFGFMGWVIGIINALRGRMSPVPGIGRWAARLFGNQQKRKKG